MHTISANELKTKGVSILDEYLENESEALISVHGKTRYVVIPIEAYQKIRELELQNAINETMNDLQNKKYHHNIKKHLEHIKK